MRFYTQQHKHYAEKGRERRHPKNPRKAPPEKPSSLKEVPLAKNQAVVQIFCAEPQSLAAAWFSPPWGDSGAKSFDTFLEGESQAISAEVALSQ